MVIVPWNLTSPAWTRNSKKSSNAVKQGASPWQLPTMPADIGAFSRYVCSECQQNLESLLCVILFQALKLSSRARQQVELGKVVNLMSADVNHVMQFLYPFMNQLVSAPAVLITALTLLWFQIR